MPAAGGSRALRSLLTALLALWAILEVGAGFVYLVAPPAYLGFTVANDGTVTEVEADSPAAGAGIRPGDRILRDRLSPEEAYRIFEGAYRPAGTPVLMAVERGGATQVLRLVATATPATTQQWIAQSAAFVETLVFVGIASALVLLRPTPVTWAFLLLSTGYPIVQFGSMRALLAAGLHDVFTVFYGLAAGMAVWGAVVFTLRFPSDDRSYRGYERLLKGAAVVAGSLIFLTLSTFAQAERTLIGRTFQGLLLVVLVALVALIVRRNSGDPAERAKGRWVLAASVVGIAGMGLDIALHLLRVPGFLGSPLDIALPLLLVLMPLSVAYAVLRHRVIDVRFAINRALVYGFFTSALVIGFSFVEYLVGKLEEGRVAQYAELAIALGIGFSFNLAHKKVEGSFERIFFRSQHDAAARLRRVIAAIPHATSRQTVDEFVVREPYESLGLASAALFVRDDAGDYRLGAGAAWPPALGDVVPRGHALLAYLGAAADVLDLDDVRWDAAQAASEARRPVVAVPIATHGRLLGFACYGETKSGEALDPGERRLLADIARAAGAAYDYLETEALRAELDALRAAVARRAFAP